MDSERSIYHAENIDVSHYQKLLSMHDPGEKTMKAVCWWLIMAGRFIYTGLVFPSIACRGTRAYRIIANLLAPRFIIKMIIVNQPKNIGIAGTWP